MRSKEEADEYRYFPDPDLPIVNLKSERIEIIRRNIPELPDDKIQRFIKKYGLSNYDAEILSVNIEMADYFEKILEHGASPKITCNWIIGNLTKVLNESKKTIKELSLPPENLSDLTKFIENGEISSKIAKKVFEEMISTGEKPNVIIDKKGLKQISDEKELTKMIEITIDENKELVKQYKAGKKQVIGHFVGEMMKKTKGKGNPALINNLLKQKLEK